MIVYVHRGVCVCFVNESSNSINGNLRVYVMLASELYNGQICEQSMFGVLARIQMCREY